MRKFTVELYRDADSVHKNPERREIRRLVNEAGYLSQILDKMVNWSMEPENQGLRIYRHALRWQYENIRQDDSFGNYYPAEFVVYLDIYAQ